MSTSAIDTMRAGFRTVDGTLVRYADTDGAQGQSILLTSPWPESLYAFAPIWSSLAKHARLFAVDLPGFGRSERRDDLLSPRAMGEFIARLIDDCGLRKPHIVAPDIGTSAALSAAAARPDRISSVVVGGRGPGHARRHPRGLPGVLRRRPLRRVDAVRAQLSGATAGAGAASPPDRDPGPDHRGMAGQRRAVRQCAFLHERLRRSRLTIVDAGHFVWEEAPSEYASIVIEWLEFVTTEPWIAHGDLVVVARAQNQAEGEFLQGLLRAEGVPSLLRRAPGFDVPDFLAAGPRQVLVASAGVQSPATCCVRPSQGTHQ